VAIKTAKRWRVKRFFRWYDLWIGAYIKWKESAIYICFLPMCGVKIWRQEIGLCGWCDRRLTKVAHNTGDGWLLYWRCECIAGDEWDEDTEIKWPFGDNWVTGAELEELGYELV